MIMDKETDAGFIKININFFEIVSNVCESIYENIEKE
jgi:hypothetical protein